MTTAYTSLLGLALPVTGELAGTWGDTVNDYITKYLDASVAGTQTISGSQTAVTLSVTTNANLSQVGSGATGSAQYNIINCTGNPASMLTVTVPAASKTYVVVNATSTNQQVKIVGAGPTTGVTLDAGEKAVIAWNGSDFIKIATSAVDGVSTISFGTTGLTPSTATSGAVTVAGTLVAANGGTGQSTYTTGDLLYATGSTALSKLGIGTNGQILTSTGTAPQWSTLSGVAVTTFSAGTTGFTPSVATSGAITLAGTLATTNGGTGLTSFSANQVFYASSTSAVAQSVNLQFSGTDLTVYGITVGRGAGAVSTNTAVGASALAANTTGANNTAFGAGALPNTTSGARNTAVGSSNLRLNVSGVDNSALGYGALDGTTGSYNTAVGSYALVSNTTASNNTAVGYQALYSNISTSNNTAVGYQAAYSTNGGTQVTAFGAYASQNHTSSSPNYANTALGYFAGNSETIATDITYVGGFAGRYATGNYNTALGAAALYGSSGTSTASDNTGVGYLAGASLTTGGENTLMGSRTGQAISTGVQNIAIGAYALGRNTTGSYNTAVGRAAVGGSASTNYAANDNVGVGAGALSYNQTGSQNTALGTVSLYSNTTASNNTAVGYQAGYSNTTGTANTYLGEGAGYSNTTSSYNTFIGEAAGRSFNTSGDSGNTFVGVGAGYGTTTGTANTFVGAWNPATTVGCGQLVTTGSKNTILGSYNGNQGGLDIRTANNYIVLSDGDGNPRLTGTNEGVFGVNTVPQTGWSADFRSIQLGLGSVSPYSTLNCNLAYNWYYGAGGANDRFMANGYAVIVQLNGKSNGDFTVRGTSNNTSGAGAAIAFTDLLSVTKDTTLALQGGATSVSGTGITFPATQNASSNANTLDDYEQGTWTPTIVGSTTAGAGTYQYQTGRYTKVGNIVTATAFVEWTAHTGTGNMRLGGLPFTTLSASSNYGGVSVGYVNNIALTANNVLTAYTLVNSTECDVYQYPVGGGASTAVPIDTAGAIIYTVTYLTAD